jgi:oligo-1,6-glucosidase
MRRFSENPAHIPSVYKSPQVDMGYDISDYTDIDERYGSLADVDELIAQLDKREMKLMMDLVVNHTSDQVMLSTDCPT